MDDSRRLAAHGAWRTLRRLLPRGFRERCGDEVLATHVALAGGARRARGAAFWSRVARDVAVTAVRLRWDARELRGGGVSTRGRNPMAFVDVLVGSGALAVRTLKRRPGFALAVIVILALGISANVTIFRVLDRLLLSPPEQIRAPEEVKRVFVLGRSVFTGTVTHSAALSYPDYRGLTEVAAFEAVAGYTKQTLTADVEGVSLPATVEMATASYFEMLGVVPALGRFYDRSEDALDASAHVAVLSWSFWQRQFGGERSVLGRALAIGRSTYTVIGVAPRGFTGVDIETVDVWLPLMVASAAESGSTQWVEGHNWYMMAGAVRVSGSTERSEAEATLVRRRLREGVRGTDPDARVVLAPLIAARGPNASRESQVARMLAALTALVLLVTCANVGNLYLARVLSRRRELAIQAALGVSRGRVFAQLIVEVAIVALVAGALAWWIGAQAAGALFRVLLPDAAAATGNGLRVLALTVGLALLTALLTGVLPAMRATRIDAGDVLRRGTSTRRILLLRRSLLLVQAALSVVLLSGSGLFIRSLQRARAVDLGLDTSALTISLELQGGIDFGEQLSATLLRMLPVVRASNRIETAAAASLAPFSGWWGQAVFSAEGDSVPSSPDGPFVYAVTGEYFETLRIPMVRGRMLTDADAAPGAALVAVVNERLAARLWPGQDPLGRCLRNRSLDDAQPCATVVGVAADFLPSISAEQAPFVFYVPRGHNVIGEADTNVILARPAPGISATAVAEFVESRFPELRRVEVAPLDDLIAPSLRAWRLGASLLTAVGVLALVIAAAGLYSMLAFDVLQRRRELGIRAALGASTGRLVRGAVAASFGAVALGVLLGLGASLLAGRAVEAMLFRVSARDPAVYAAVCIAMLAVGVVAGVLPARHVTRTDPAIPLRDD